MWSSPVSRRVLKVGCVSFLNSKPLIYGLEEEQSLRLVLDVPSGLLGGLREGRFEVALLPVIDYQRMEGLRVVPAAGIGCNGPTLTVRIFSRVPIEEIRTLACDTDSHTSIALARVILAEKLGIHPEFANLSADVGKRCDARLLIGDKVVCEEPKGFEHQLDLGEAWKQFTNLPFVFAVWMARADCELGDLPQRLERAKRLGLEHVDEIITRYAVPRGWPAEIARQYLTSYLQYDIGPAQLRAIELFHQLAAKYAMIDGPVKPLRVYSA